MSNRGHCSDSERFISTCNDLQEHGRHPKSLQDSLRHRCCVPRCVPRSSRDFAKLIDWLREPDFEPTTSGSDPAHETDALLKYQSSCAPVIVNSCEAVVRPASRPWCEESPPGQ